MLLLAVIPCAPPLVQVLLLFVLLLLLPPSLSSSPPPPRLRLGRYVNISMKDAACWLGYIDFLVLSRVASKSV